MRQCKNVLGGGVGAKHAGFTLVPAKPGPLVAHEPKKRDPWVSEYMWEFPKTLARLGNERSLSQKDLAAMAGVDQGTISRWLHYKGLAGISPNPIQLLEQKMGLKFGELLPRGNTMSQPDVSVLARRMGLGQELLLHLSAKETGAVMDSYTTEARRAILGVAHVYGATLEQVLEAVGRVTEEYGQKVLRTGSAPDLYELIRGRLKTTEESGMHPSAGKIDIRKRAGG